MKTEAQTQLAQMIKRVTVEGRDVIVVVDNVKQFRTEAVEKLTVRPNKRRTQEGRLHHLVHTFLRSTVDGLKGKHINVHLVAGTDKDGLYRNEKGHFVTREKLAANPELAAV